MTKGNGLPCKKCGTSQWYKDGRCVVCQRGHVNRWRNANLEKQREATFRWRTANPEKAREATRRWEIANAEWVRERGAKYRRDNVEREREKARKWATNNPDKRRAKARRDQIARRARKAKTGGSFTEAEWNALVAQYDGHCCYPDCNRTDLHADHVVPIAKGGSSNIENIQPLCAYHNQTKSTKTVDYRYKGGIFHWIQKKLFG